LNGRCRPSRPARRSTRPALLHPLRRPPARRPTTPASALQRQLQLGPGSQQQVMATYPGLLPADGAATRARAEPPAGMLPDLYRDCRVHVLQPLPPVPAGVTAQLQWLKQRWTSPVTHTLRCTPGVESCTIKKVRAFKLECGKSIHSGLCPGAGRPRTLQGCDVLVAGRVVAHGVSLHLRRDGPSRPAPARSPAATPASLSAGPPPEPRRGRRVATRRRGLRA
jgi:hypothetical protein